MQHLEKIEGEGNEVGHATLDSVTRLVGSGLGGVLVAADPVIGSTLTVLTGFVVAATATNVTEALPDNPGTRREPAAFGAVGFGVFAESVAARKTRFDWRRVVGVYGFTVLIGMMVVAEGPAPGTPNVSGSLGPSPRHLRSRAARRLPRAGPGADRRAGRPAAPAGRGRHAEGDAGPRVRRQPRDCLPVPAGHSWGGTDGLTAVPTLGERGGDGFLSAEQQRRYGRYRGEPDQAQLDRYFHLDATDRDLVDVRRGEHNRLGFAVQLGAVRFLGTFLPDPADVPWAVAAHLAGQLGIADPGVLKAYAARDGTNRLHAAQIQQAYGYRDFTDPQVQHDLVDWLQARVRLATERPGVLFDLATSRLLEAKVLLPGPTVLARLVASVRDQAATWLWEALSAAPDAAQRTRLEGLLSVANGERTSTLERLRRGPTSVTAAGLLGALQRLEEIRALDVGGLDL